jgi:hypothetical protein
VFSAAGYGEGVHAAIQGLELGKEVLDLGLSRCSGGRSRPAEFPCSAPGAWLVLLAQEIVPGKLTLEVRGSKKMREEFREERV